jgi:DNA repair protein RecO (recombination protein O)
LIPYSQTSRIVSWITPSHGRIATIFKGACRPKSPFLGQYDLFYTCDLVYYSRERGGIHIGKECTPILPRDSLRKDWRSAVAASYISDLVSRLLDEGGHNRELYLLARSVLSHLAEHGLKPAVLCWFDLRILKILGLTPQLSKCATCSAVIDKEDTLLSTSHGGLVCSRCVGQGLHRSSPHASAGRELGLNASELSVLKHWLKSDSPAAAYDTFISREQWIAFSGILGIFLAFHLDILPVSRRIVIEMLGETRPVVTERKASQ